MFRDLGLISVGITQVFRDLGLASVCITQLFRIQGLWGYAHYSPKRVILDRVMTTIQTGL